MIMICLKNLFGKEGVEKEGLIQIEKVVEVLMKESESIMGLKGTHQKDANFVGIINLVELLADAIIPNGNIFINKNPHQA